ncbi:glycoside hydrolase family 66 protein [Paenibacillus beijingensis]|uniref:glycoside hydrolase family 66 protein n=1 Tax=Paenibacillus beijingensis TaxID=1126833 RepID=UPI00069888B9|nr:glycoside hydrolase family 66 protein [Paenibacillus beijingensis]
MMTDRAFLRRAGLAAASMILMLSAACTNKEELRVDQIQTVSVMKSLSTDKASYKPGDSVKFSLSLKSSRADQSVLIRYKHLNKLIKEETQAFTGDSLSWKWKAPADDGTGYMVEVILNQQDKPVDHSNIAVDVSSDWGKFPRYGYLADFPAMSSDAMIRN